MARNYSVEDVENLRRKSGIGYEEAIRLLDKYNGDMASALIELEKSGHIGKNSLDTERIGDFCRKWWNKGLETHVLIERKEKRLADLPVLICILLVLCAPRTMLLAAVVLLLMGGHISLTWDSKEKKQSPQASEEPPISETPEKPSDGFDRITID